VFGVKQSLQVIYEDLNTHDDVSARLGMEVPFKRACYEFVMESA
jgi:catechol 1,2-dioxygenase